MNLKTTLVLLVLVAAVAALLWFGTPLTPWLERTAPAPAAGSTTLTILEDKLTPEQLRRIDVRQGDRQVVLERGAGGDWTLPGKWPTRPAEVQELIGLLTGLRSRFAPISIPDSSDAADLKDYGLDQPRVVVTVRAGDEDYRLAFGEAAQDTSEESNRFARATYLRLDTQPVVLRLRPGIVAALDRPPDYYQQRRLFLSDRVAKENDPQEKVERLSAKAVAAEEKKKDGAHYTLNRTGAGPPATWELQEPVHDRPDPDKLNALLTAVPDIWAEQFVDKPKKDLAEYGLQEPEQTLRITRPTGETVTLLIGKQSRMKTRMVTRPAPPFGPPMPPQREVVHEEYRYGKLMDNEQIFEIKADKLKDIFVGLDTLRDARLARFRTEDARKIEVQHGGQDIVLAKDKERWKLQKPVEADAETAKVNELLDKLSGLQTKGKEDVLDKKEPKEYGLDKPDSTVKVTVEEEVKGTGDAKAKKTRIIELSLGKRETDKSKLYVKVDGWERINAVDDDVLKLAQRPALAYRGRRIFDFSRNNLDQLDVQRGDQKYQLKQSQGVWRLASPVEADADTSKAGQLAGDLGQLEAVEYVDEAPKPEDLEKAYGLDKPALTAALTFTDKKKPAETLLIGKQREKKPEYFARLADKDKPAVFVVKKEIRDALDQDSLAFRPTQLWQLQSDDIAAVRVQRQEEPEFRLTRKGSGDKTTWEVSGPFEAAVSSSLVKTMLNDLLQLRCERYEAHTAKDLKEYGLDQPHLKLTLLPPEKKEDADKKPVPERVLLIGKPTAEDAKTRFAKLGSGEAIFVVGEPLAKAVDRGALDLLDRNLLTLDTKAVTQIKSNHAGTTLILDRADTGWQVVARALKFRADSEAVNEVLGACANLHAQKFAAYGPKVDWPAYGLDKPAYTLTVTTKPAGADAKPVEHTLAIGKAVENAQSERYARLDNGPGVFVLGTPATTELSRTYLDFVERTLLKLDPSSVTAMQRHMGDQGLDLVKRDDGWHMIKPTELRADGPTLDALVEQLSKLRATRVAAYPANDLKRFGLEQPAASLTLRLAATDGKPTERVVKIGAVVDKESPAARPADRFVLVDGSAVVGVLAGDLAQRLLAGPLHFRDRGLARFPDADKAVLERGPRKATFAKIDGTWKLTAPVETEAEQADLEDFINALARLRADELVAEKPADLKPFGLDKPEARWHFLSGDKEVLGLLVGSHEKTKSGSGPRCYAKLATGDLVFLLDPRITGRALGEYRKRTLWTGLDAAQVEALHYGRADNPFTLEKMDQTWQVVGKPDVKVKAEAVSETLAALAGLRAERFVIDQGADLKLYGLEPPQLVLEARTRTGKRILHVGRPEGESKRYYARLPEEKRTDVFVISEADAAKIVRELIAFTQGGPKGTKSEP